MAENNEDLTIAEHHWLVVCKRVTHRAYFTDGLIALWFLANIPHSYEVELHILHDQDAFKVVWWTP